MSETAGALRLDRLPAGITGFDGIEGPGVDEADFRTACHLVERTLGSHRRIEFDSGNGYRTYYAATVEARGETVSVLCNRYFPFVGFVKPGDYGLMDMTFLSPNWIGSTFATATHFKPLDALWLNAEITADLVSELGPHELKTIRYWRPATVGDIVFNGWD